MHYFSLHSISYGNSATITGLVHPDKLRNIGDYGILTSTIYVMQLAITAIKMTGYRIKRSGIRNTASGIRTYGTAAAAQLLGTAGGAFSIDRYQVSVAAGLAKRSKCRRNGSTINRNVGIIRQYKPAVAVTKYAPNVFI